MVDVIVTGLNVCRHITDLGAKWCGRQVAAGGHSSRRASMFGDWRRREYNKGVDYSVGELAGQMNAGFHGETRRESHRDG